jgi:hypothetical protein
MPVKDQCRLPALNIRKQHIYTKKQPLGKPTIPIAKQK